MVCKKRLFLSVEEKCIPCARRIGKRSLTKRQCYKEFDDFSLRVLQMGRRKIKCETKREKREAKVERVKGCYL